MFRTWPGSGTGVGVGVGGGVGVGATVNVQVASWSATATALPASAAALNTVCGQSNVAPLTQAGMSRMILAARRGRASSAPRSFAVEAHARPAAARTASGSPNRRSRAGWTRLTGTPATSCLPSVNRITRGARGVGRQVLGGLTPSRPRSSCRRRSAWRGSGRGPCGRRPATPRRQSANLRDVSAASRES